MLLQNQVIHWWTETYLGAIPAIADLHDITNNTVFLDDVYLKDQMLCVSWSWSDLHRDYSLNMSDNSVSQNMM